MGFLGRLKKRADKEPKIEYTSGEYMENMDGAYVHGGFGPEEEPSAKEIQRVTQKQVLAALAHHVHPDRLTVAIAGHYAAKEN